MIILPRHSGEGRNPCIFSRSAVRKFFIVVLYFGAIILITAVAGMTPFMSQARAEDKKEEKKEEKTEEALAAEEKEKASRFAPDFCDFEITFPEPPVVQQKCLPDGGCFDVNSYTMVYDLQTTVDVTVTCNPSTPDAYEEYNEGVMKAALSGMIDNKNLTSHEVRYQTLKDQKVKNAALTGAGITGRSEKIYSGQLWIGPNSVFTVQAELIGSAHTDADKSFRDILASIKTKAGKQVPRPKKVTPPQQNNQ